MWLALGIELEVSDYEVCGHCGGDGETDRCPNCRGRGRVACTHCGGRGNIPCKECGYRIIERREPPCPECGSHVGYGVINCPECGGMGTLTCDECEGTGEVEFYTCPMCGGAGYNFDLPFWADDAHAEHCGVEIKGQTFLDEDDEDFLLKLADDIASTAFDGGTTGPCGMHIHIGRVVQTPYGGQTTGRWEAEDVASIVRLWKTIQPIALTIADTKACRVEYCEENPPLYPESAPGSCSRYYALNAWDAWRKHGTVEFRLWNASDDEEYVYAALRVSIAVVRLALELRLEETPEPGSAEAATIQERFIGMLPESIQAMLRGAVA